MTVAGGEPPEWSDPSDLTRISLAAAGREFGAGGEPTRPSEAALDYADAHIFAENVLVTNADIHDALAAAFDAAAARVVAAVEARHGEDYDPHDCDEMADEGCEYVRAARGATGGGT